MSPIRCIIIDDEPIAISIIEKYVAKERSLIHVGSFTSVSDARKFLSEKQADLIFLDIEMPGKTGISFLKTLPVAPAVIFTTAYREYALEGFELDAVDYLLKPIPYDRFIRAVKKAEQRFATARDERMYSFKTGTQVMRIREDDIEYIESAGNYAKIIYKGGKPIISYLKLNDLETKLPSGKFIRIHRSYIVAINKISSYTTKSVFIGQAELPIGVNYREEVKKKLSTAIGQ